MGATVAAYDPAAMHETRTIYGERSDLILTENSMDALQDADALLVVTEWKAFRSPNFTAMKARLKTPVVFDGRNLYDPATMRAEGFEYFAIGRRT